MQGLEASPWLPAEQSGGGELITLCFPYLSFWGSIHLGSFVAQFSLICNKGQCHEVK